ncbi:MAG: HyaD/HybD family hydrogenase maturation endopeptidase [Wenzhouxiangellaceae bacterium]|nr:HyaD/HybD family hydrogenase maturation endopeptidase [Wenzhouxiangellaceae bacterium]
MQVPSTAHEAASETEARTVPFTVIGIGNNLMTDDGAGVYVVEQLLDAQRTGSLDAEQVRLLDGGTLSFTLLDEIEQADHLIIVDAAELHADPGTVQAFHDAEMDAYLSDAVRPSVHEVNLLDVLTAARLRGTMPRRYSLIGIQPDTIEWGTEPSDAVRPAIEQARDLIIALIDAGLPGGHA